jgi:hypothetical protein
MTLQLALAAGLAATLCDQLEELFAQLAPH